MDDSFLIDIHVVRFLISRGLKSATRLLTENSLEKEVYALYATPNHILLSDIRHDIMENLIRSAVYLSNPGKIFDHQQNFTLRFPDELSEIPNKVNSISKDPSLENAFDQFFSPQVSPPASSNVSIPAMKKNEFNQFIESLSFHGYFEWEKIANDIGRSIEDIVSFGHHFLLSIIQNLDQSMLAKFNLLSVVLWHEFFPEPYSNKVDKDPSFWKNFAQSFGNTLAQFSEQKFSKIISNRRDNLLDVLQRKWILKAFYSLHPQKHLPFRFCVVRDQQATSPDYVFNLLNSALNQSERWTQIKEILQMFPFTECQHQDNFQKTFYYVHTDVLSHIYHAKQESIENEYKKNPYISLLLEQAEFGPFCPSWNESEIKRVTTTLSSFFFPILKIGEEKISPEFRALTCITSKSFEQIKEFTESFLQELHSVHATGQITLGADILHSEPGTSRNLTHVLSKEHAVAFHHQVLFLRYVGVLAINGVTHFPTVPPVPPGWNLECGMAIFRGICQYGLDKIDSFLDVLPQKIHGKVYDHVMNKNLSEFKNGFNDPQAIFNRFKILILNNKAQPRHFCPWYGNHVSITIVYPPEYEERMRNEDPGADVDGKPPPLNYRQQQVMEKALSVVPKVHIPDMRKPAPLRKNPEHPIPKPQSPLVSESKTQKFRKDVLNFQENRNAFI